MNNITINQLLLLHKLSLYTSPASVFIIHSKQLGGNTYITKVRLVNFAGETCCIEFSGEGVSLIGSPVELRALIKRQRVVTLHPTQELLKSLFHIYRNELYLLSKYYKNPLASFGKGNHKINLGLQGLSYEAISGMRNYMAIADSSIWDSQREKDLELIAVGFQPNEDTRNLCNVVLSIAMELHRSNGVIYRGQTCIEYKNGEPHYIEVNYETVLRNFTLNTKKYQGYHVDLLRHYLASLARYNPSDNQKILRSLSDSNPVPTALIEEALALLDNSGNRTAVAYYHKTVGTYFPESGEDYTVFQDNIFKGEPLDTQDTETMNQSQLNQTLALVALLHDTADSLENQRTEELIKGNWTTADRRVVPIKDMEPAHFDNAKAWAVRELKSLDEAIRIKSSAVALDPLKLVDELPMLSALAVKQNFIELRLKALMEFEGAKEANQNERRKLRDIVVNALGGTSVVSDSETKEALASTLNNLSEDSTREKPFPFEDE